VGCCFESLADSTLWSVADLDRTFTWAVIYLGHARKSQEALALHKALRFLGDIFLSAGDNDTVQTLFSIALEGFTEMDVHQGRAECMLRLGDIMKQHRGFVEATELWREARKLFERSLQTMNIDQIDARLATVDNSMLEIH
jgi:hypothetical protein